MRLVLLAAVLLTGCVVRSVPSVPDDLRDCAAPVPVPAPIARIRTPQAIGQLEIRVELAREAERARADDCAKRLRRLNAWIGMID